MKQTVEEQAREYAKAYFPEQEYIDKYMLGKKSEYIRGFIQGAEWQARQSPWISVEERLPEDDNDYYIGLDTKMNPLGCDLVSFNPITKKFRDRYRVVDITHYMPIHTFDQILEANKGVSQQLKDK